MRGCAYHCGLFFILFRPLFRPLHTHGRFRMIDLRHLSLTWQTPRGSVHALRDIDLHIPAGEMFGIIGRSGAGKSSLVRCINLLNRPTAGEVIVGGQNLLKLNAAELRRARQRIGMVFQHFNLLSSRTVFDNVALPLELMGVSGSEIAKRVGSLLDLVGLSHLAHSYPARISGGQKQRVGIARALASDPQVLLSDEATSALDPETTRSILELLRSINRELGLTVVLITHQMQVIKDIAAQVAVMDAGRIVERGRVLDVFTTPTQAVTRSLIDEIIPQSPSAAVREQAAAARAQLASGQTAKLVRVVAGAEQAGQPWLAALASQHGLGVQLLHGQIDHIQGQSFAALTVLMSGHLSDIDNALRTLKSQGVHIQDAD